MLCILLEFQLLLKGTLHGQPLLDNVENCKN